MDPKTERLKRLSRREVGVKGIHTAHIRSPSEAAMGGRESGKKGKGREKV